MVTIKLSILSFSPTIISFVDIDIAYKENAKQRAHPVGEIANIMPAEASPAVWRKLLRSALDQVAIWKDKSIKGMGCREAALDPKANLIILSLQILRHTGHALDAAPFVLFHFQVPANHHANQRAAKIAQQDVQNPLRHDVCTVEREKESRELHRCEGRKRRSV